tara:strand:+ start:760 stop:2535 length:1776 start_codon:yes stop_codon:yes gene_type:complete
MPLIFNDGSVVNYDLINTRVARLDSDDGPMMIVDMNYPEFKSASPLTQGPWRDSAGGEGKGQLKWSDAYPSDGFDSIGNENDMYNAWYQQLESIKVINGEPSADESYIYTVHSGAPIYKYRQYVGSGNYELRGSGNQICRWKVNSGRGDLSEFHRFSTDSDAHTHAENVLFSYKLTYGGLFRSYPTTPLSEIVDIEWINKSEAFFLNGRDDAYWGAGNTKLGEFVTYASGFDNNWGWTSSFGYSGHISTYIDSDYLNVGSADDFRISSYATAKKIRIQKPDTNQGTSQDLKLITLVSGVVDGNSAHTPMDGSNDMLISSTLTAPTDTVPSCDSAQYHFHIMTHPALVGPNKEIKRQTHYKSINEFDISEDGTRLFLDVMSWDGASLLMQINITTPWDLSTIELFDYYDSASATSNGGDPAYSGDSDYWAYRLVADSDASFGRVLHNTTTTAAVTWDNYLTAGTPVGFQPVNATFKEIYSSGDSAIASNGIKINNIADIKSMFDYDDSTPDTTLWVTSTDGGGYNTKTNMQWNNTGDILYHVHVNGKVTQYDCTKVLGPTNLHHRDLYINADSNFPSTTSMSGSTIQFRGRR